MKHEQQPPKGGRRVMPRTQTEVLDRYRSLLIGLRKGDPDVSLNDFAALRRYCDQEGFHYPNAIRRRLHRQKCQCKAYGFPHRAGSGSCFRDPTDMSAPYCVHCGGIAGEWRDCGVDSLVDMQPYCYNCGETELWDPETQREYDYKAYHQERRTLEAERLMDDEKLGGLYL